MQVLGSDLIAFMNADWPENYYLDDGDLTVVDDKIIDDNNESLVLPLTEKYDLDRFGFLASTNFSEDVPTLTTFFRRWQKEQTTRSLVISFDKDREPEIREALRGLNVKVLR
jgi:hypothetical protein